MRHTLILILVTSFWTVGLFMATYEGEVLHPLKNAIKKLLGDHLSQPFISCPYCMPSVHGTLIVLLYHYYFYQKYGIYPDLPWDIFRLLFIIVAASAVNYILFNLIRSLKGYADLFDGCPEVTDIETEIKQGGQS